VVGAEPRTYAFALAPAVAALALAPALAVLADGPPVGGPARALGVVPLLAGLALAGWGVRSFAAAGVVPSPAGTPDRLVTRGALAHTRNPVYLGTVVATTGTAVVLGSPVAAGYAALLWAVYHALVVVHEEPALRARHDGWAAYASRVPRWGWRR